MARHSLTDMVELTIAVPRGHEGFWSVIRELDAIGPWTRRQVDDRCNVDRASIKDYVLRLQAGGFVQQVGTLDRCPGTKAILYRLKRSPLEAPRLDRQGRELAEPMYVTLWRTMKMAKTFTVRELAQLAGGEAGRISTRRAGDYVQALARVGIVARVSGGRQRGSNVEFRLVRHLGARAPQIMRSQVVFDPNSRTVVGSDTREVAP